MSMQETSKVNIAVLIPDEKESGYIGVIASNDRIYKWFVEKISIAAQRDVRKHFIYMDRSEKIRGRMFTKLICLNKAPLPYYIHWNEIEYLEGKWNIKTEDIDTDDLIIK
jgi:hypothetical protein